MSTNPRLTDPGRPKIVATEAQARQAQAANERRLQEAERVNGLRTQNKP